MLSFKSSVYCEQQNKPHILELLWFRRRCLAKLSWTCNLSRRFFLQKFKIFILYLRLFSFPSFMNSKSHEECVWFMERKLRCVVAPVIGKQQVAEPDKGCISYDPRKRPWYILATAVVKDLILLLDIGQERDTTLKLAVNVVSELFDTLRINDTVNMVTFDSVAATPISPNSVSFSTLNLHRVDSHLCIKSPFSHKTTVVQLVVWVCLTIPCLLVTRRPRLELSADTCKWEEQ